MVVLFGSGQSLLNIFATVCKNINKKFSRLVVERGGGYNWDEGAFPLINYTLETSNFNASVCYIVYNYTCF